MCDLPSEKKVFNEQFVIFCACVTKVNKRKTKQQQRATKQFEMWWPQEQPFKIAATMCVICLKEKRVSKFILSIKRFTREHCVTKWHRRMQLHNANIKKWNIKKSYSNGGGKKIKKLFTP